MRNDVPTIRPGPAGACAVQGRVRWSAAPLWLERLFVYLGALGWWITGAVSVGECWHNNHHAFPASSRIGHATHELDPGWWVLLALQRAGLVSALALPGDLPYRPELRPMRGAPSIDRLMLRERSAHER